MQGHASVALLTLLIIVSSGLVEARADTKETLVLEAAPRAKQISPGGLVLIDLTLRNTGADKIPFTYHLQGFSLPLYPRAQFEVILGGKVVPPETARDKRIPVRSNTRMIDLEPGKEWKVTCCMNRQYSFEIPGEYEVIAKFAELATSGVDPQQWQIRSVSSRAFRVAVVSVTDQEAQRQVSKWVDLLSRKVVLDEAASLAILSLAYTPNGAGVSHLTSLLLEKKEFVNDQTLDALSVSLDRMSDDDKALDLGRKLLKSGDAGLRHRGIGVFRDRGRTDHIPEVAAFLDDPDWSVRAAACYTLGRISDFRPKAVETAKKVEEAKDWWRARHAEERR